MSDIIIGILLVISFFFMVWYCVKGYNLMVGFAIMATVWMGLALVGNTFSPNPAMEGQGVIDVLTHIYTTGPAEYAKSILVNVFFGAFFGRVLVDSGIAATLIRKVVELGGDKPRITMSLLCIVTAVIFMSMTGIGPVISIAVIVLPILMSLGISVPVACSHLWARLWLESLLISSISNNIKRFMLVSIQRLKAILIMTISKLV